jgi:hypothetical protein
VLVDLMWLVGWWGNGAGDFEAVVRRHCRVCGGGIVLQWILCD